MPSIRGTGIQASSAGSYTVSWPAGTVAGDTAIILAGGGFAPNVPIGWAVLNQLSGTNWNGAAFFRVLTAADISTGHVTVTFAGTFDSTLAIVTLVGRFDFVEADFSRNGSGSTSITGVTTTSAGDFAIYFGSNRGASTDTCNRGTLKNQSNDLSAASGCLYIETSPAGSLTPTFSYSSAGTGNYQGTVVVNAVAAAASGGSYAFVS